MTTTDLVPSVSIDLVLQKRDDVARRVAEAHKLITEAIAIADSIEPTAPRFGISRPLHLKQELPLHRSRKSDGFEPGAIMGRVDGEIWDWLMAKSGMLTFMDAEAKEKWRESVSNENTPELTRSNIEATFAMLHSQRSDFFDRGVINLFNKLSWDYKTNSPVKIGRRLVMTHVVEPAWKGGKHCRIGGRAEHLDDLLRVMAVADGEPEPDHRKSARDQLNAQLGESDRAVVGVLGPKPKPMFEIRAFKNGNVHVHFVRSDLIDNLNRIIAKHHPNVLPPAEADR